MPKSDVIERAAIYCSSTKFERIFDDFAREHAETFLDALDAKGGDVEHKHEYKEIHDKYLRLFEEELSDFVESEGSTIDEFFRECRAVVNAKVTGYFDEHKYVWFVEHLLASMEYELFFSLMINEARRLRRK
ncbi:hypothetical protein PybrP1_005541 [[Pythium] brassicae (nom. inval.)]|nr:hypothetical protein PybrP1_005541 [[Pythium] brassicae (nom. inval.)]